MSHPNKHIDELQTRLNQARLAQQRNSYATGFSFPRFVASLRAALKGIRKQDKQDPRELVCDFADAIPGFNEMLKKMNLASIGHLGSDLFEIALPGGHAGIPLLDPVRQVVSVHGKVLLDNYKSIDRACTQDDDMYFCLRCTNDVDVVELIEYDKQTDCFRTLIAADKGYDDFLVLPKENTIVAYKGAIEPNREFRLDNLEPIEEDVKEQAINKGPSRKKKYDRKKRYYTNLFGIAGKHRLEQNSDGKYALLGIDPVSQEHRRITGWHSKILNSIRSGSQYIYAIDEHEDGARDIVIYGLNGDLLYKKKYASSLESDALHAFNPLPLGFHTELDDTNEQMKIVRNGTGNRIEGLEFKHMSKSGLGTMQCIWMPRKDGYIQFGLYSLEKQYRIIPPVMLSQITFVSGVAILNSPEGIKAVLAKDILECENKGISYQ
ncbi:MAG: hypothetical protein WC004_03765 [Candidatus Absconditabacterales bacterium]